MPQVSVVIPCYNYGRYLRECVASVLTQQGCEVRVLIVDDASTDGSADIARALARDDRRVETILRSKNKGHIAAYNEGIAWARGDYFLLLSADDLAAPGAFARAAAVMQAHPDVVLAHGHEHLLFPGQQLPSFDRDQDPRWVVSPGIEFVRKSCWSVLNEVGTSTAITRLSAQKAVGGYRAELPHAGDIEMWLRMAARGSVAYTGLTQGIRREHPTNMSKGFHASRLRDYHQRQLAFEMFFAGDGASLSGAQELLALAKTRLADTAVWSGAKQIALGRVRDGVDVIRLATRLRPGIIFAPPLRTLLASINKRVHDPRLRARLSLRTRQPVQADK